MRLKILDSGHDLRTKALFLLIRLFSREPVLDVMKLVKYRSEFLRTQLPTHTVMRGASDWSVGDRELMAAVVAQSNQCQWCTTAHAAVAKRAYRDAAQVSAVLADLETAPIAEPLRATLRLLRKLMRKRSVIADDVQYALSLGVSRQQIQDALAVCFAFSITSRLASAFGFTAASPRAFELGAKYLLRSGYR